MAEVLQLPRQPDGQSFYQPSSLRRSSPSSSSLFLDSPSLAPSSLASSSQPSSYPPSTDRSERGSASPLLSSPPSSPASSTIDFSACASALSPTPTLGDLSLGEKFSADHDIDFPNYDGVQFFHQNESFESRPTSLGYDDESSDEPADPSTTTDTTRSDSPLPTPTVADDTAVKQAPSRHVDYLSHDWREEDIWSSWRHIVSQRKVYGQRSRLENASWRTWAKSKYRLRTVSPETLNWLKESDVTWLYGPLKPALSHPITHDTSEPTSQLSKNNSFINKKPILKKRSMSEVMLQKSLSATSLLKQAAASVQAQEGVQMRRATINRTQTDLPMSTFPSETPSRDQVDYFTSQGGSSDGTPSDGQERRHIRFDDKVEQCIAVECKEGDFDEDGESEGEDAHHGSDSSSDDGLVIMKPKKRPATRPRGRDGEKSGKSHSHSGPKTIETLPATTLKYRTDSPDVDPETQQQHSLSRNWRSPKLSPSPSQETLRPSRPSQNYLLGDGDEGEVDSGASWSFGANNPKSSLGASASSESLDSAWDATAPASSSSRMRSGTPAPAADDYTIDGMRRTNSGMLMPQDEDEDDLMAVGLFGRVSETINTAKDIAHVIWNVGWRK